MIIRAWNGWTPVALTIEYCSRLNTLMSQHMWSVKWERPPVQKISYIPALFFSQNFISLVSPAISSFNILLLYIICLPIFACYSVCILHVCHQSVYCMCCAALHWVSNDCAARIGVYDKSFFSITIIFR